MRKTSEKTLTARRNFVKRYTSTIISETDHGSYTEYNTDTGLYRVYGTNENNFRIYSKSA